MDPEVVAKLRAAVDENDPRASWYLDTEKHRVVEARDGRTNCQDLTAEEVEEDERRFVEIPAVTTTLEFTWIEDFVAETADWRLDRILDRKQGAVKRFLEKLPRAYPEAQGEWRAFRAQRVAELVDDWLAGLE